jgi:DNA-binding NarL/FixJ family response regulator
MWPRRQRGRRSRPDLAGRSSRIIAATLSNDEIAARLAISPRTVEAYLREIFRRHGFQSRTELAVWAVQEGWLDAPLVARRR